jgi:hypothetical protein
MGKVLHLKPERKALAILRPMLNPTRQAEIEEMIREAAAMSPPVHLTWDDANTLYEVEQEAIVAVLTGRGRLTKPEPT